MSRPGDPDRELITVETPADTVTLAADLARRAGARTFEFRYDAADRHLPDGEEPRDDERIRWQCIATWPTTRDPFGRRTHRRVVGEAVVEPGQDHGTRGGQAAAIDFAEKLGANVVVIDLGDDDPRA